MALSIKITRTLPLHPLGCFVQWDLVNPTEVGSYLFDVYRGGSPDGPWTLLAGGAVDTYNYIDRIPSNAQAVSNDQNDLSLSRGFFYRVVVTPPSGAANQVEVVSVIEPSLDGRQRLLKRKFVRDLAVGLKRLNGVPVALVKRMHWGARCSKCYDKYTKDVVRANCTTCMGTGFAPGYHKPVGTLARRSPTAVETAMSPEGKQDLNVLTLWMLDAPRAEEDDVLVFLPDNRRFLVKKVLPTELKTVSVHQKLIISELAKSSVEFRLVVDPTRIPSLF
jgi:hypothetical protein